MSDFISREGSSFSSRNDGKDSQHSGYYYLALKKVILFNHSVPKCLLAKWMRSENTEDTPIISGTLSLLEDYFGASELRQGLYMTASKYLPLGMDI